MIFCDFNFFALRNHPTVEHSTVSQTPGQDHVKILRKKVYVKKTFIRDNKSTGHENTFLSSQFSFFGTILAIFGLD